MDLNGSFRAAAVPPAPQKWVSFADLSRTTWGRECDPKVYPFGQADKTDVVLVGAAQRTADATELSKNALRQLLAEVRELRQELAKERDAKRKPDPASEKAAREAASRRRAWAAYAKARAASSEALRESVDDLGLTWAVTLSLKTAGFDTLGKLIEATPERLLELRAIGEARLDEIKAALLKKVLALRGEEEEPPDEDES